MSQYTQLLLLANHILQRFALNRSRPVRKRLSWTHALRGMWHPGGKIVKLEIYRFKESGTGGGVVLVSEALQLIAVIQK